MIKFLIEYYLKNPYRAYKKKIELEKAKLKFPNSVIEPLATITDEVVLSPHVRIGNNVIVRGKIHIGKGTFINGPTHIASGVNSLISIGAFCSIADFVYIINNSHSLLSASTFSSRAGYYKKLFHLHETVSNINIGNDVWIGAHAIILGGVTIGDGAVIGAGSVVTKDIAPYSIVGGVPAKEIRKRFSEDKIELLLGLKWWNYSDEQLFNLKYFFELNIEELDIDTFRKLLMSIQMSNNKT